jgi:hypothetical protein
MRTRKLDRGEWNAMIGDGRVKDAPSVAAYGLLLLEEASGSGEADDAG